MAAMAERRTELRQAERRNAQSGDSREMKSPCRNRNDR
jgi:hypothetical protein